MRDVLELRHLVQHHLDPGRGASRPSGCGMQAGGPAAITFSWIVIGGLAADRRHGDGRDLLDLPDRRRPVLLGGEAGEAATKAARGRAGSPGGSTSSARSLSPRASTTRWPPSSPSSSRSTTDSWFGMPTSIQDLFIIYVCVLIVHGLLNTFGVRLVESSRTSACGGTWSARPSSSSSCSSSRERQRRGPRVAVRLREPHRLVVPGIGSLRVQHRHAAGAVHDHRLRRLGPRERGDDGARTSAPRRPSCARSTSRPSRRWFLNIGHTLPRCPKGTYANEIGRLPVGWADPGAAADLRWTRSAATWRSC